MDEEIESLENEIKQRFEAAGKTEFVIGDKIKIEVSTLFGQEAHVEISNPEDPNEGMVPLEFAKPEILEEIRKHFDYTTPDRNPFIFPDEDSEDPVDKNPFILDD